MSNVKEIGIPELINQIKKELLTAQEAQDDSISGPIFFIDKIELEIAVKVQKEGEAGVKVSVLSFAEIKASGGLANERGQVVKVSLSPLIDKEKILDQLLADPDTRAKVIARVQEAIVRDSATRAGLLK